MTVGKERSALIPRQRQLVSACWGGYIITCRHQLRDMCTLKSACWAQLTLLFLLSSLAFLLPLVSFLFSLSVCPSCSYSDAAFYFPPTTSPNKSLALTLLQAACLWSDIPWQGLKGIHFTFFFLLTITISQYKLLTAVMTRMLLKVGWRFLLCHRCYILGSPSPQFDNILS